MKASWVTRIVTHVLLVASVVITICLASPSHLSGQGPLTAAPPPTTTSPAEPSAQPVSLYPAGMLDISEQWRTAIWGQDVGLGRISIVDLDGDGQPEIVLGAVSDISQWPPNAFWYILSYSPTSGGYEQIWISPESASISRIVVADGTGDGSAEIYVALVDGTVQIYNARTRALLHTLSTPLPNIEGRALQVADVDADGVQEIVVGCYARMVIYSAVTYALEWQTSIYDASDLLVANVDADANPEIVIPEYVLDGITHLPEWHYPDGFGWNLRASDIDGDNMAEIVSFGPSENVRAFDADTRSLKWELPNTDEVSALHLGDVDADGTQEVLYGDGGWGSLHCHDAVTLVEEWSIVNPKGGMTDLSFGDVDGDGTIEVLWGAGRGISDSEFLVVADPTTETIEWQNPLFDGPLTAIDVADVDADGALELVMVSFWSDSGYDNGLIFVYDARTFALEWQSEPLTGISNWTGVHAVTVENVDDDAALEIVIGTDDTYDGVILIYDGLTHTRERLISGASYAAFYAVAAADLDQDGQVEILGGEGSRSTGVDSIYVRVYDAATGLEEWRTLSFAENGFVYQVDVAQVDADANVELITTMEQGNAYVYDGLTHAWEWQAGLANAMAVHVGDVDLDTVPEILVGTDDGQIIAFDGQTHAWEWSAALSALPIKAIRLADVNGDGRPEIIACDDEYLAVYDAATRSLVWQSDRLGSQVANGGHLIVRDVDGDSKTEIIVGSNYALYVFEYDWLPPVYLPFVVR